MSCTTVGSELIGKKSPLRNMRGKVIIAASARAASLVRETLVIKKPMPTKDAVPSTIGGMRSSQLP